jgi:hypothetical protein
MNIFRALEARVVQAGVRFGDGGYGVCAEFRRGLTERGWR